MLFKFNIIILYSLVAFFVSLIIYPFYILILQRLKAGKTIRQDATSGGEAKIFNQLHSHKAGTPTMGGGVLLLVMALLILFSFIFQKLNLINNTLVTRKETYIILFGFFSMGFLGLLDDFLNIKGVGRVKGLSAKMKLLWMFLFSGFISYFFYFRIGISHINIWPLGGQIDLGIFYFIFTFIFTIAIVNAINITDGLDGLVGGLMMILLPVMGIITFFYGWYLATTIIGIIVGCLLAFLWFNINPAKIFMGDSGALALGGLLSSLVYLLNIKLGIFLPFMIIFALFWIELLSSFLQIFWKKTFKRKLFSVAPFHHNLEYHGYPEHNIVMKLWVVQGVLAAITLITILYQFNG